MEFTETKPCLSYLRNKQEVLECSHIYLANVHKFYSTMTIDTFHDDHAN